MGAAANPAASVAGPPWRRWYPAPSSSRRRRRPLSAALYSPQCRCHRASQLWKLEGASVEGLKGAFSAAETAHIWLGCFCSVGGELLLTWLWFKCHILFAIRLLLRPTDNCDLHNYTDNSLISKHESLKRSLSWERCIGQFLPTVFYFYAIFGWALECYRKVKYSRLNHDWRVIVWQKLSRNSRA